MNRLNQQLLDSLLAIDSSLPTSPDSTPHPTTNTANSQQSSSSTRFLPAKMDLHIPYFRGTMTDDEDPQEFLESIKFSVDRDQLTSVDEQNMCSRILFRQHLKDDALRWFRRLDEDVRLDWTQLKSQFITDYTRSTDDASMLFALLNQIMNLRQGTKPIRQYVDEADALHRRIPPDMDTTIARQFIAGLSSDQELRFISHDLRHTPKFSYKQARDAVVTAYTVIGRASPFDIVADRIAPAALSQADINQELLKSLQAITQQMARSSFSQREPAYQPPTAYPPQPQSVPAYQPTAPKPAAYQPPQDNSYVPPHFQNSSRKDYSRKAPPYSACFNCMEKGHYSDQCTKPLVSKQQMSENIAQINADRDQYFRNKDNNRLSISLQPTNMRTAAAPVVNSVLLERTPGTVNLLPFPINNKNELLEAMAAYNEAMATGDKRPYSDITGNTNDPPARNTRAHRATDTPATTQTLDDDHEHSEDDPAPIPPRQMRNARSQRTRFATDEPDMGNEDHPENPAPRTPKRRIPPKPPAPIKALEGQQRYNVKETLTAPVSITLAQLLDLSPQVRRQMAFMMRSTITRQRKPRVRAPSAAAALDSSTLSAQPPAVTSHAFADDDQATVMYITGWVKDVEIRRILVDSGSVVELIGRKLLKQIPGIMIHKAQEGWGIRLANDAIVKLTEYCWLPVNISGIMATVKAYIVDVDSGYELLLSKRWMRRVRAIEDHQENTLTIYGNDGRAKTISPTDTTPRLDANSRDLLFENTPLTVEETLELEELDSLIDELDDEEYALDQGKASS